MRYILHFEHSDARGEADSPCNDAGAADNAEHCAKSDDGATSR